MKARGPEPDEPQRRAFVFSAGIAEIALEVLQSPSVHPPDDVAEPHRASAQHLTHAIVLELYFASGAFVNNLPPEVELHPPTGGHLRNEGVPAA